MVGSMDDDIDFCIEPIEDINIIPLPCWQSISLANIWIPSHLLPNRSKGCNSGGDKGVFHTLQKKDASKYSESFSIYIDSGIENDQEDTFFSDSDEDICNFAPIKLEESKPQSDSLSLYSDDVTNKFSKSFNNSKRKHSENISSSTSFRRKDDSVNLNLETSDVNNLHKNDEQKYAKILCPERHQEKNYRVGEKDGNLYMPNIEKIDFNPSHSSSTSKSELPEQFKEFKNVQTLKIVNKDSDSCVSLNEIINDAPVASLKDFNFEYKKKDSDICSFFDSQKSKSKRSRKEKKGKKLEKSVPLHSLFEDDNATQEFNCNRYMNDVLRERERFAQIGDNPLVSKQEYPDLTPEELEFIHSGNAKEVKNCETQKYATIVDDSLYREENIDLTPEESAFIYYDKRVKEKNVEFTPSFASLINETKRLLAPNNENDLDNASENIETEQELFCTKLVIENIPPDVTEDDISSILCEYGEIKNFSMTSNGKYLKVLVEIDLKYDIDWVIECLNGSELFGTSTGVLKCYQQSD